MTVGLFRSAESKYVLITKFLLKILRWVFPPNKALSPPCANVFSFEVVTSSSACLHRQ